MTAWLTGSPRYASASRFSFWSDAGADLLRGVRLAVDVDGPVGAHVALHRPDGAVGVGDRLALGHLADEHFAGLRECDHRGRRASALAVGDDGGFPGFQHRDDGVRGAEVDADGLCHGVSSRAMRVVCDFLSRSPESNLSASLSIPIAAGAVPIPVPRYGSPGPGRGRRRSCDVGSSARSSPPSGRRALSPSREQNEPAARPGGVVVATVDAVYGRAA